MTATTCIWTRTARRSPSCASPCGTTPPGEPQEIYALDAEQIDQIRELIETTTKAADYNDSIFNIVNEQAAAFFEGQKTAEDVARLIQSKANIYVNEQR